VAKREVTKTKGRVKSWKSAGKYTPKRRVCFFCTGKINEIDYKNTSVLGGYVSDRGKIEPRRRTGTCARHQRALAVAIKRARHLAMLPFAPGHLQRLGEFTALNYATTTSTDIKTEPKFELEVTDTAQPVAEVESS
jgi:small subunit ribosomal protein S18